VYADVDEGEGVGVGVVDVVRAADVVGTMITAVEEDGGAGVDEGGT
jgi:hypothetical protein